MIEQCFGGIDVSQDRLDVLLLPQGTGFSVANDEAGWSTLIGRLRGLLLTAIGLEPSGGYERGVLRALLAAGLSVRRINPNRLRQFARARGALAKNDRIDARLIAEYVATMPTHVVRHDPAAARIAEIVTMRRQLCDEHVASENQAAQLEDAMLRRLAKRRLARIETDIRLLEKRLTETIAAEADLARRYARLTSMPGVGPVPVGKMGPEQLRTALNRSPFRSTMPQWQGETVPPQQEQRVERRLSAIFAADVAGYSRLISQDEAGTLRALSAARQIMDRL